MANVAIVCHTLDRVKSRIQKKINSIILSFRFMRRKRKNEKKKELKSVYFVEYYKLPTTKPNRQTRYTYTQREHVLFSNIKQVLLTKRQRNTQKKRRNAKQTLCVDVDTE